MSEYLSPDEGFALLFIGFMTASWLAGACAGYGFGVLRMVYREYRP